MMRLIYACLEILDERNPLSHLLAKFLLSVAAVLVWVAVLERGAWSWPLGGAAAACALLAVGLIWLGDRAERPHRVGPVRRPPRRE